MSQAALGKLLGVSRSLIGSIEEGRAAIRWELYRRLGDKLSLNPYYLALCEVHPHVAFDRDLLQRGFPPGTLFSTAFQTLPPRADQKATQSPTADAFKIIIDIERLRQQFGALAAMKPEDRRAAFAAPGFADALLQLYTALPAWIALAGETTPGAAELAAEISAAARRVRGQRARRRDEKDSTEKDLRTSFEKENEMSMATPKQELAALIREVKRLTSGRGSRKKLADALSVTPQRVSDWLSGKFIPDGINVIRLQNFVRESKQTAK